MSKTHRKTTFIFIIIIAIVIACAPKKPNVSNTQQHQNNTLNAVITNPTNVKNDSVYYYFENELLILTSISKLGSLFPTNTPIIEKNDSFYIAGLHHGFTKIHHLNIGDLSYQLIPTIKYNLNKGVLAHTLFNEQFIIKSHVFTCLDTTFEFIEHDVTLYTGEATSPYRNGENGVLFSPFERITSPTARLNFLQNTHLQLRLKDGNYPKHNQTYHGEIVYLHEPHSDYTSNFTSSNFVFIEK